MKHVIDTITTGVTTEEEMPFSSARRVTYVRTVIEVHTYNTQDLGGVIGSLQRAIDAAGSPSLTIDKNQP